MASYLRLGTVIAPREARNLSFVVWIWWGVGYAVGLGMLLRMASVGLLGPGLKRDQPKPEPR
jgi:hypothetical protein